MHNSILTIIQWVINLLEDRFNRERGEVLKSSGASRVETKKT